MQLPFYNLGACLRLRLPALGDAEALVVLSAHDSDNPLPETGMTAISLDDAQLFAPPRAAPRLDRSRPGPGGLAPGGTRRVNKRAPARRLDDEKAEGAESSRA